MKKHGIDEKHGIDKKHGIDELYIGVIIFCVICITILALMLFMSRGYLH